MPAWAAKWAGGRKLPKGWDRKEKKAKGRTCGGNKVLRRLRKKKKRTAFALRVKVPLKKSENGPGVQEYQP